MPTQIALLGPANLRYVREAFLGVADFAATRGDWQLELEPFWEGFGPRIAAKGVDGVIALFEWAALAEELRRHVGCPIVNVGDPIERCPLPVVRSDDDAIARMAAHHFIERGFRRFGYVEYADGQSYFSRRREAAFRDAVGAHGCSCAPAEGRGSLEGWLISLAKPCALLAANDHTAQRVAKAAQAAGVRIPEDVALLGVDDDELVCSLSTPTLSSLDPNARGVGQMAAHVLDELLRGERGPVPNEPICVPPVNVVVRASTDTLAIEDEEVAAAIRFIRANASQPIGVEDILDEVPISRRAMERRFRAVFGHGPADEIRQYRVQRAKELLATSDLSMPRIAEACGFGSAAQFSIIFRRLTRQTPTEYRRAFCVSGRGRAPFGGAAAGKRSRIAPRH